MSPGSDPKQTGQNSDLNQQSPNRHPFGLNRTTTDPEGTSTMETIRAFQQQQQILGIMGTPNSGASTFQLGAGLPQMWNQFESQNFPDAASAPTVPLSAPALVNSNIIFNPLSLYPMATSPMFPFPTLPLLQPTPATSSTLLTQLAMASALNTQEQQQQAFYHSALGMSTFHPQQYQNLLSQKVLAPTVLPTSSSKRIAPSEAQSRTELAGKNIFPRPSSLHKASSFPSSDISPKDLSASNKKQRLMGWSSESARASSSSKQFVSPPLTTLPRKVSETSSSTEPSQGQLEVQESESFDDMSSSGERRLVITLSDPGILGKYPQKIGKRNAFVPDRICGRFKMYHEHFIFRIEHGNEPQMCRDGVERICITWTVINEVSGEETSLMETPQEAMRRQVSGKTICNRVYKLVLDKRADYYEREVTIEKNKPDVNECRVAHLTSMVKVFRPRTFSLGPLAFGLLHSSVQDRMLREFSARHKRLPAE